VTDVVSLAVNIPSSVETGRLGLQWHLAHGTSETAHVPGSMETSHLEHVTLLDRLAAAAAAVVVFVVFASTSEHVGHVVFIVTALDNSQNTTSFGVITDAVLSVQVTQEYC
jgi:hypothetical protein